MFKGGVGWRPAFGSASYLLTGGNLGAALGSSVKCDLDDAPALLGDVGVPMSPRLPTYNPALASRPYHDRATALFLDLWHITSTLG